jgi:hypothetical protein
MRIRGVLFGAAVGAAIAYLFDAERGRDRRARLLDRGMTTAQRASERLGDPSRSPGVPTVVVARIQAVRSRFLPVGGPTVDLGGDDPMLLGADVPADEGLADVADDATLVDRIRSQALGDPRIPAGEIHVDVADGIATIRGELSDPALIEEILERTRAVRGVLGVENLLHTPAQEPAKNKRAAIRASDKAAESTPPTGEAIE